MVSPKEEGLPQNPHHNNPDTPSRFDDGTETVWNDGDNTKYPYYDASSGMPPVVINREGLVAYPGDKIPSNKRQPFGKYSPSQLNFFEDCASLGPDAMVCRLDPFFVRTDKDAFQYKEAEFAEGVTGVLHSVRTWRNDLSGMSFVWVGPDEIPYIVDGHQRLELARRLKAQALMRGDHETANKIYVTAKVWRHDSPDLRAFSIPEQKDAMRLRAALKNIAEKTGTILDAAEVLRAMRSGKYDHTGIIPDSDMFSRQNPLIVQAEALSQLTDDAYKKAQRAILNKKLDTSKNTIRLIAHHAPYDERLQSRLIDSVLAYADKNRGKISDNDTINIIEYEKRKLSKEIQSQLQYKLDLGDAFDTETDYIKEMGELYKAAESHYRREARENRIAAERSGTLSDVYADDVQMEVERRMQESADASSALSILNNNYATWSGFLEYHAKNFYELKDQFGPESGVSEISKRRYYVDNIFMPQVKNIVDTWDGGGKERIEEYSEGMEHDRSFDIPEPIMRGREKIVDDKDRVWDREDVPIDRRILLLEKELVNLTKNAQDAQMEALKPTGRRGKKAEERQKANMELYFTALAAVIAREKLLDRYWIDARDYRKEERTPNIIPSELDDYLISKGLDNSHIAYSINDRDTGVAQQTTKAIETIGIITQKMDDTGETFSDLPDDQLDNLITSARIAYNNISRLDPEIKNILKTIRDEAAEVDSERRKTQRLTRHRETLRTDIKNLLNEVDSNILSEQRVDIFRSVNRLMREVNEIRDDDEYKNAVSRVKELVSKYPELERHATDTTVQPFDAVPQLASGRQGKRSNRTGAYSKGNRWAAVSDGGTNQSGKNYLKGYRVHQLTKTFFESDHARAMVNAIEAMNELKKAKEEFSANETDITKSNLRAAEVKFEKAEKNLKDRRESASYDPDYAHLTGDIEYPDYNTALANAAHLSNLTVYDISFLYNNRRKAKPGEEVGEPTYKTIHPELWDGYNELAVEGNVFDDRGSTSYYESASIPLSKDWNYEESSGVLKQYVDKLNERGLGVKLVRYKNQYEKLPDNKGVYPVNKQTSSESKTDSKPNVSSSFDAQMEEYMALHSPKPTIRRKKRRRAMPPTPNYVTAGIGGSDKNKGKDLINKWFKRHKPPRRP